MANSINFKKQSASGNLHETAEQNARVVLAGLNNRMDAEKYARSMQELANLAKACGLEPVSEVVQNSDIISHSTYIGTGKLEYLRQEIEIFDADLVVFNETLSPLQVRNLEKALDTEVMDRTGIILHIFSLRARTNEARMQVEYARLEYILPRLAGMYKGLSRQGGGSGRLSNKGAGEQKIELDRRRIEHRITQLRRNLEVVERERAVQRSRRMSSGLPRISLVGYTNAGKSTLMNALLRAYSDEEVSAEKQVFEKDMLFATLDTSVRRIDASGHLPFLLTDTVGFISDLPHSLVKAFRSTLEEACYADLLLEVVDFSDPGFEEQIRTTDAVLEEIGAGDIPILFVYNKSDLMTVSGNISEEDAPLGLRERPLLPEIPLVRTHEGRDCIYMSARSGLGLEELLSLIDTALQGDYASCRMCIPFSDGNAFAKIREQANIHSEDYSSDGYILDVTMHKSLMNKYSRYLLDS